MAAFSSGLKNTDINNALTRQYTPEDDTAAALGRRCPQHLYVRLRYIRCLDDGVGTAVTEFG
jgi:hypothetical protein